MSIIRAVHVLTSNGGVDRPVPCDVPCVWRGNPSGNVWIVRAADLRPPNTILMSMEGPHYYPQLRKVGKHLALATTSFSSAIPMPYFNWDWTMYLQPPTRDIWATRINAPAVSEHSRPRILFMAHNCNSLNNREQLVSMLQNAGLVDSISDCMNNVEVPPEKRRDKHKWMQKYMFYASFENGCETDYVTEKMWGALAAGTLPIYYGAPNIAEHAPAGSYILLKGPHDVPRVVSLVRSLMKNRTAYMEYHAWRNKPLPEWFKNKYDLAHVHSECRTCRYIKQVQKARAADLAFGRQQGVHVSL